MGCDWDFLLELANEHRTLREMRGHGGTEIERYDRQDLEDNVRLMTPELLKAVNGLIVSSGHDAARKKIGAALGGRIDSSTTAVDMRSPKDVNLPWDAMRCLLQALGRWRARRGGKCRNG